jgi:predicted ATPase/DNA-binding CsgD family transcriptional regulator
MVKSPNAEHGFPPQPTPFIGRSAELAEIGSLLATPTCRLLMLLGPGGIGKTRLAIEAATGSVTLFVHGIYFVALQPLPSTGFLASAIADAVRIPLSGQTDPHAQLLHYLRDKHILLVLDNFEHLLNEAERLADLLSHAPRVKLLVTSREALNLQEEWLYPVQGLPFPGRRAADQLTDYSAVRLFVERAQRVRHDFSLASEHEGVVRICQLVEGMPLALELAAAWAKTLSCAAIAEEIERSLAFLATNLRNVPERHRSTRAVFDQTWQSLTEVERNAFKRLAVFRGGFGREAAAEVAGACLSMLLALADKSLLQIEPGGRHHLHEVLRQHAEERWGTPEEALSIQAMHSDYYARYLHDRLEDILGRRQREVVAEIEAELENVRAAWHWAVERANVEALEKSAGTLAQFYQMQSRYLEGAVVFEQAARRLATTEDTAPADLARVGVLTALGWFYVRVGRIEEAENVLTECRALFCSLGMPSVPGLGTDPRLELGFIACARGDYGAAAGLAEQARQTAELLDHPWNRQVAYDLLSRAVLYQGQPEMAQRYAQIAYAVTQETQDRWFMAYCLNQLGNVAHALGDDTAAHGHYAASYALREEMDDPEGMAVALNHLGQIARLRGNESEAKQLYQRSLAIFQDIADPGGLMTSLAGLGGTMCGLGEYESAREYLQSGLEISLTKQLVPHTFTTLVHAGELLLRTGRRELGLEVLTVTLHHPASGREAQEHARQLLRRYRPELALKQLTPLLPREGPQTVKSLVVRIHAELQRTGGPAEPGESVAGGHDRPPQTLLEPLTARELEVLRLVAAGLSNPGIAEQLIVSVGTVKSHLHNITEKLGASNRTQAVYRARELHLL